MNSVKLFHKNDRVVFFGDSITHANRFVMYIYEYYHRHFPKLNIKFFNSGISGGSLPTGFDYYDKDFSKWQGNVVVMMYGMNDSNRDALLLEDSNLKKEKLNKAFETYKANLDKMCKKLIINKYRLILCTPTPYDDIKQTSVQTLPGGGALIRKYADFVSKYALENNIELVDFNSYMTELVTKNNKIISDDHVHPTLDIGHYEMAKCFLKHQQLDLDFTDLSEDFCELDKLIQKLRDTYAADFLFIPKNLTLEEKIKYAKDYPTFADKSSEYYDYFSSLSKTYYSLKGKYEESRKIIETKVDLINKN